MLEFRSRVVANTLAALGGVVVVALHLYAGILDSGRPVLRPVGEETIFLLFGWILSLILCVPALILTRGRSRVAIGVLAVTLTSAGLLFSV